MSQIFTPKLCVLTKKVDFDGYGFNLHSEKGKSGQYIGKVDEFSPAEAAGLRQGLRIIEVNGVNIGAETHKEVVERIKAISDRTELLVIDGKVDVHNSNQIAAIEKFKNSLKAGDNENNNGTIHTNNNETHPREPEIKSETNGNDSIDSVGSSKVATPTETSLSSLSSMTVAEMRAQLKSKKRPDPKTTAIDVKQKYEIIQKM